jgi:ABC-type Mn2+/Zn2+ transport system permease subunit
MPLIELGSLVLSVAMAVAAGLVGAFAVMRRMTLAADAISHVALPGIGVALLLHVHPILGALVMLFLGTLLIWSLQTRTRISIETVIGVVFTVALAIGSFVTSGEELIDALFGAPGNLGGWEIALGIAGAAAVIVFVLAMKNALIISLVSADIARTAGINVIGLNLVYLFAFALTIALGLRFLGVLLMGSLIIIPAATARRLVTSLGHMLAVSAAVAVVATLAGSYLGTVLHRETGPLIVSVAGAIFFLSLLKPRPP